MQGLDDSDIRLNQLFDNRYRIRKALGKGGMGCVYLAEDTLLDNTEVAIKLLHKNLVEDDKQFQRFLREVQLSRRITHKNIVRTFEINQVDGRVYFAMEYVPGATLSDMLAEVERLTLDQFYPILLDICYGLASIHEQGIVHRDLKPANIILSSAGIARISDFGIARTNVSELTHHSEVVGSTAYLSPEAWTGTNIDHRTDIYALGILAYEMLTGKTPFDAESSAEFMFKHLEEQPVSLRVVNDQVPGWLDHLILSMLAKDPDMRPESAEEIIQTLEKGFSGQAAQDVSAVENIEPPRSVSYSKLVHNKKENNRKKRLREVEESLKSSMGQISVEEVLAYEDHQVEQDEPLIESEYEDPLLAPFSGYDDQDAQSEESQAVIKSLKSDKKNVAVRVQRKSRFKIPAVCFSLMFVSHILLGLVWEFLPAFSSSSAAVCLAICVFHFNLIWQTTLFLTSFISLIVKNGATAVNVALQSSISLTLACLLAYLYGLQKFLFASGSAPEAHYIFEIIEKRSMVVLSYAFQSFWDACMLQSQPVRTFANDPELSYSFYEFSLFSLTCNWLTLAMTGIFIYIFSASLSKSLTKSEKLKIFRPSKTKIVLFCLVIIGFDFAFQMLASIAFNPEIFTFDLQPVKATTSIFALCLAPVKWMLLCLIIKRACVPLVSIPTE